MIQNTRTFASLNTRYTHTHTGRHLGRCLMHGSLQFPSDVADHLQHIRIFARRKSTLKHHRHRIATDPKSAEQLTQVCALLCIGHVCSCASSCVSTSMHIATSTRLDQTIPKLFQVKPHSRCLKNQQAQTATDSCINIEDLLPHNLSKFFKAQTTVCICQFAYIFKKMTSFRQSSCALLS